MPILPRQSPDEIARRALGHLEQVVRIDSASDERSATLPSTVGQARLSEHLAGFFAELGASVERDANANLVATFAGRGAAATAAPLALLIHLDTARGTQAIERLDAVPAWDGRTVAYSANPRLEVDVANYPSLAAFVGQTLLHGPGDAPFGLDDKLGLAHLMTLAWLLGENPEVAHPPLIFVGRPDEEIARMQAVKGLAALLAERGVQSGYTIDGIEPYEINVANFNGSRGSVWFAPGPRSIPEWPAFTLTLGGVNTHGATAKAEGHRPATRLGAELLARLGERGLTSEAVVFASFVSDALRDCDAELTVYVRDDGARAALAAALEEIVGPHVPRGASWRFEPSASRPAPDAAVHALLGFVARFLASAPGFALSAEDSSGWEGYSQPYRAVADERGLRLDVRLRDFDDAGMARRCDHLRQTAAGLPVEIELQYANMGPKLAGRPELAEWAKRAGQAVGVETRVLPIRGGTGVDPFLERGVALANLGTGYFAPESEKELTTLELMAGHAAWLFALVQVVGAEG
ncbi:MAG: hypothetical protein IT377_18455 [Polyangiaceae bacterium]|nr:hypothetical protein [Polyangiaceae bacterium]